MRLLKLLLALTIIGSPAIVSAAPVTYSWVQIDTTGVLVPGATVTIGATTLTSNTTTTLTATTVPNTAGELINGTRAQPSGAPIMTLIDYGDGGYSITYDPSTYGELHVPLTVTLAGHTFLPAVTIVVFTKDSSYILTALPNAAPTTSGGLPTVNSSNQVSVGGVVVTTNNDKTGYSLTTTPPTASQNAATLMSYTISHGLTFGQIMVLLQAAPSLVTGVTNTWNASTHILSTAYQFSGDGSPIITTSTQYPTSQVTNPAVASRTTTTGTIPQP